MTKIDNRHPNGIEYPPNMRTVPASPVVTRQMTSEERERYGLPQPRPARGMSPVSKVYYAYLDGKLAHYAKRYDYPASLKDSLRRFNEV